MRKQSYRKEREKEREREAKRRNSYNNNNGNINEKIERLDDRRGPTDLLAVSQPFRLERQIINGQTIVTLIYIY